ncbi:MAG: tetratricopeptide repeat protein [Chloroflexi bacterium]|nr:tetratricopeptide repeat protein [Chloroflexota bacterium]
MTQDAEFYFKRSAERYKAGDVSGGDADLDQAIALAPDNLEYRWERGMLRMRYQAEQHELALEDFSKIIELSTDIEELDRAYGWRLVSYDALGLKQALLADLDWLIAHDLADALLYSWRSHLLYDLERYEEALEDVNKAIEMAPKHMDYLVDRARIYEQLKRYEDEINDLTSWMKSVRDSLLLNMLYMDRATAFFKIGNKEQAYADFEEAIRRGAMPFTSDPVKYFTEMYS